MAMSEEVSALILALRRERHFWGPKKLRAVLERDHPRIVWPAASRIGDLLRREGLNESRHRRRTALPVTQPFPPVAAPNDLWCIDFEGWFRTADGQRCDPLTITDAESRFLIECRIVPETIEAVWPMGRPGFSRAWASGRDSERQWRPVRVEWRSWVDAAVGALAQTRHPAGAHRSRQAPAEPPA
jgi:hypothetical protein